MKIVWNQLNKIMFAMKWWIKRVRKPLVLGTAFLRAFCWWEVAVYFRTTHQEVESRVSAAELLVNFTNFWFNFTNLKTPRLRVGHVAVAVTSRYALPMWHYTSPPARSRGCGRKVALRAPHVAYSSPPARELRSNGHVGRRPSFQV
jgi:hypothetical protein